MDNTSNLYFQLDVFSSFAPYQIWRHTVSIRQQNSQPRTRMFCHQLLVVWRFIFGPTRTGTTRRFQRTKDSEIPCIGGGGGNYRGNDLKDSIFLRSKIKTSRNSGQGRHQGHRHQLTARHSSARCPRPRCCAPGIELKRYHAPMCIPINRPICVALGSVGHQPFSLPAPKLLWGS